MGPIWTLAMTHEQCAMTQELLFVPGNIFLFQSIVSTEPTHPLPPHQVSLEKSAFSDESCSD